MTRDEKKAVIGWIFDFIWNGIVMAVMIIIFFLGVCLI
tara:strand:- start:772 stop:885 length:114 start_codon:yes stop_codon:yes gene_type:complete